MNKQTIQELDFGKGDQSFVKCMKCGATKKLRKGEMPKLNFCGCKINKKRRISNET